MGYSRYIGRVGALAVALGIGVALANGPATAWADGDDGSSSGSSSSTSDSSSGARFEIGHFRCGGFHRCVQSTRRRATSRSVQTAGTRTRPERTPTMTNRRMRERRGVRCRRCCGEGRLYVRLWSACGRA